MKLKYKKLIILAGILALIMPILTRAQSPQINWMDCLASPVSCVVLGMNALVLTPLVVLIDSIAALIMRLALLMGEDVVNSAAVRLGFGVMLSLANLGFVLGIIVIAIATMLRNQTYGIKRTLFRLVAMAVLVNFSLVIAGIIINFSNQLSIYFLKATVPVTAATTANVIPPLGFFVDGFTNKLVTGLAPQQLLKSTDKPLANCKDCTPTEQFFADAAVYAAKFNPVNQVDITAQTILGIIFTLVFGFAVALVLLALALLFLIRYLWLVFLLILMPLAWIAWVFQGFEKHWQKWWNHFLRWTFFTPIVLFFLYLAMIVVLTPAPIEKTAMDASGSLVDINSNISAQLGILTGHAPGSVILLLRQLLGMGLIVGGIFAANALGITLADTAWKGVGQIKGWAEGAVKRGARRAATSPTRAGWFRNAAEGLQKVGAESGLLGRTLTAPIRGIGQGMDSLRVQGTKGVYEEYKNKYRGLTKDQVLNMISASRGVELMALLDKAKSEKYLNDAVAKVPNPLENIREADFKKYNAFGDYLAIRNSGLSFLDNAQKRERGEIVDDTWIPSVLKGMEADQIATFLLPYEKARGGKNPDGSYKRAAPLGLADETQWKLFQAEIARNLYKFGSPAKMRAVLDKFENDEPWKELAVAGDYAFRDKKWIARADEIDPRILKWMASGAAAGMGVDDNLFGTELGKEIENLRTAKTTPAGNPSAIPTTGTKIT